MGQELNSLLFSFFLQKYMQLLDHFRAEIFETISFPEFFPQTKGEATIPETRLFK